MGVTLAQIEALVYEFHKERHDCGDVIVKCRINSEKKL